MYSIMNIKISLMRSRQIKNAKLVLKKRIKIVKLRQSTKKKNVLIKQLKWKNSVITNVPIGLPKPSEKKKLVRQKKIAKNLLVGLGENKRSLYVIRQHILMRFFIGRIRKRNILGLGVSQE